MHGETHKIGEGQNHETRSPPSTAPIGIGEAVRVNDTSSPTQAFFGGKPSGIEALSARLAEFLVRSNQDVQAHSTSGQNKSVVDDIVYEVFRVLPAVDAEPRDSSAQQQEKIVFGVSHRTSIAFKFLRHLTASFDSETGNVCNTGLA